MVQDVQKQILKTIRVETDADTLGKNIGDDLAEGKPTLPLILGRKLLDDTGRRLIDDAIRHGEVDGIGHIVELVRYCGALYRSHEAALSRAAAAEADAVPESRGIRVRAKTGLAHCLQAKTAGGQSLQAKTGRIWQRTTN